MRVPAVVGSWPEPFLHGFEGEGWEVAIDCRIRAEICDTVRSRLAGAGATVTEAAGAEAIRVKIGIWARIRGDGEARLLTEPPGESGVFATFTDERRPLLTLLNQRGEPAGSLGRGAGLVAALRPDEGPPTWVVTGANEAGVRAATELLDEDLRDHFAVATDGAGPIPVPVP